VPVARSFSIAKVAQTITFAPLLERPLHSSPLPLTATASSGLLITYQISGPCMLIVGSPPEARPTASGSCTITATQPGNTNTNAAAPVSQTLTVVEFFKLYLPMVSVTIDRIKG
jgi:hypothetical protein